MEGVVDGGVRGRDSIGGDGSGSFTFEFHLSKEA